MSRPKRLLRKRFEIFCEGDTEYHYIDGMRTRQGVEIALCPINMKGGGYAAFLNELKTKGQVNCVARFMIVDGDRITSNVGEAHAFEELVDYCRQQNKKSGIPCFIILNNPNFEYVACLHAKDFTGQSSEKFICDTMGFERVADFKKKEDVYGFLNANEYCRAHMIARLKSGQKPLYHRYTVKRATLSIEIRETVFSKSDLPLRGSNFDELFDVIDWPSA